MSSWQKIAVIALAFGGAIAVQILVKDPDGRAMLTGFAGTLIGWMVRSPGDAPALPPSKGA